MSRGLLTRDNFREAVFKRDKNLCLVCNKQAKDAHHILERKLWEDGGYSASAFTVGLGAIFIYIAIGFYIIAAIYLVNG